MSSFLINNKKSPLRAMTKTKPLISSSKPNSTNNSRHVSPAKKKILVRTEAQKNEKSISSNSSVPGFLQKMTHIKPGDVMQSEVLSQMSKLGAPSINSKSFASLANDPFKGSVMSSKKLSLAHAGSTKTEPRKMAYLKNENQKQEQLNNVSRELSSLAFAKQTLKNNPQLEAKNYKVKSPLAKAKANLDFGLSKQLNDAKK